MGDVAIHLPQGVWAHQDHKNITIKHVMVSLYIGHDELLTEECSP